MTTGVKTATVDWNVVELDGVADVIHSAAARAAAQYRHVTEYDDMLQQARLILAEAADDVRDYLADAGKGISMLHHRLWCDLVDSIKTEGNHRADQVSFEALQEEEQ